MKRLNFKDIKKGDRFKANCTGFVWTVSKRKAKSKKLVMWTRDKIGCVEMEFGVGQINREFVKVEDN